MQAYQVEKWIWTEKDFDHMGWHDATVYGVRLNSNLEIDLDYIFQWNHPDVEGFYFTFWVAPCTLIFENPTSLTFELTQSFDDKWIEIQDIEMTAVDGERNWVIITQQGNITFKSESFKQIIRKQPSLQLGQAVPYDERGGFSFDLTPADPLIVESRPEILQRRNKRFEDYELAKRRFALTKDLESLNVKKENGLIQTKDYLVERKGLKEKIDSLTFRLRGSSYES